MPYGSKLHIPPTNYHPHETLIIIIIKVFLKSKTLSRETILSGYTRAPVHMSMYTLYTIYKQLK